MVVMMRMIIMMKRCDNLLYFTLLFYFLFDNFDNTFFNVLGAIRGKLLFYVELFYWLQISL